MLDALGIIHFIVILMCASAFFTIPWDPPSYG